MSKADAVVFACALWVVSSVHANAQSSADDTYPMSRDAAARDLVDDYVPRKHCAEPFMQKFQLDAAECAARLATARERCPSMITDGLPAELDEKLAYRLVGRSKVCMLTTLLQRAYNAEAADRASEVMWEKDHPQ